MRFSFFECADAFQGPGTIKCDTRLISTLTPSQTIILTVVEEPQQVEQIRDVISQISTRNRTRSNYGVDYCSRQLMVGVRPSSSGSSERATTYSRLC